MYNPLYVETINRLQAELYEANTKLAAAHPPLSRDLGNRIVDECYQWVKGDGPEPYSPTVASLVVMVNGLAMECEAATAGRIAAWLDTHASALTLEAESSIAELFRDVAADIRAGTWRR